MKLYEFEKSLGNMTIEDIEAHMMLLLNEMDAATDSLIEHNKKIGNQDVYTDNRINNTQATS